MMEIRGAISVDKRDIGLGIGDDRELNGRVFNSVYGMQLIWTLLQGFLA